MTKVRVIADERSTGRVYYTSTEAPRSAHTDVTEARLAAHRRGGDRDAERVVVHDRYHRAHGASPAGAGGAAREQLARARLLDRVRERARTLARAAR
jgi:hypothetical protein